MEAFQTGAGALSDRTIRHDLAKPKRGRVEFFTDRIKAFQFADRNRVINYGHYRKRTEPGPNGPPLSFSFPFSHPLTNMWAWWGKVLTWLAEFNFNAKSQKPDNGVALKYCSVLNETLLAVVGLPPAYFVRLLFTCKWSESARNFL